MSIVGEDLDVLLELCDRILVLCGGKVSGIVPGRGADKREIGMMMTRVGGNEHEVKRQTGAALPHFQANRHFVAEGAADSRDCHCAGTGRKCHYLPAADG